MGFWSGVDRLWDTGNILFLVLVPQVDVAIA